MPARLPPPSPDELRHSEKLVCQIRDALHAAGGCMDFMEFVNLALYAPQLGYYRSGAQKFGATGDFVTAPELGSLFARCLARQCLQILRQLGGGDILEAGAGSGALAADLLQALEQAGQLPERYLILELSAELRARQQQHLATRIPHLMKRVTWLGQLPEEPLRGVVIANELLDAIPSQRFRLSADGAKLLQVTWSGNSFRWHETPAPPHLGELLRSRMDAASLPEHFTSEIGLQAEAWVRSTAGLIAAGALLVFDYGFPRAEFYHPDRHSGTLMCHYRHHVHDDPLVLVGLQDITAHIDFTAIAEAGCGAGLSLLGYTSQAAFLLATGITDSVPDPDPDVRTQVRHAREIQMLTLPHEMGEIFKAMALGRGLPEPLLGFALHDRRGRL